MDYSKISDSELRSRLIEHDFPAPPVNDSTRPVLIRKLKQLDLEAKKSKAQSRNHKTLMDYSSAEEDSSNSPKVSRRRISLSRNAKKNVTPRVLSVSKTNSNDSKLSNRRNGSQRLATKNMNFSEEEDDDEEEEESVEEEEEDDEEEEEVEEEQSEDEEDLDDESRIEFGIQTSPHLDSTTASMMNGSLHYRGANSRTPLSSRRSNQYSYNLSSEKTNHNNLIYNRETPTTTPMYPRIRSPQLREIVQKKEFGSLGEALGCGPNHHNSNNNKELPSNTSRSSSPQKLVTQVHKSEAANNLQEPISSKISKFIMFVAIFFFVGLLYSYSSLRPSYDIENRIPICGLSDTNGTCILSQEKQATVDIFKSILDILERHHDSLICTNKNTQQCSDGNCGDKNEVVIADKNSMLEYEDIKQRLDPQLIQVPNRLFLLMQLLTEKPQWGIEVLNSDKDLLKKVDNEYDIGYLSLTNPYLNWTCWTAYKYSKIIEAFITLAIYAVYIAVLAGSIYLGIITYRWRKESKLQQQQEVYELVEQVLSLLVAQQQNHLKSGIPTRPWVASTYIRDKLIAPQDRQKKAHIWNDVVKFIRNNESRVREDTRDFYGEESHCWQWIPDIQWAPMPMSHTGPNPYVYPMRSPGHSPNVIIGAAHPGISSSPSTPSSPLSNSASSNWQGSAFNSLNSNVATPEALTSCVKVRHLFDPKKVGPSSEWIWGVREEILNRCQPTNAKILHIAVDKDHPDGCVYIRCADKEDANKVFKSLHGQWYKGSLVMVKYLKEDRYFERFPDAKYLNLPLRSKSN